MNRSRLPPPRRLPRSKLHACRLAHPALTVLRAKSQGILFDVDAVAAERTQRCRSALEDHGLDLDVPLPATAIMSLGNTRLPDGWSEVKRSCRTRRLVLSSERYLLQADPKTKQITIGPLTDDQAASRRGRQQV